MPYFSVIVPTYNSERTIEECLKHIRKSSWKDFELIVSDSASSDNTVTIARGIADKVIESKHRCSRSKARWMGISASNGEIIVNIDSDVLINNDTLEKLREVFLNNSEADGVTGILSETHPNNNFASSYKNLYMHYVFSRLKNKVSFLYGSLFAIRRECAQQEETEAAIADDTALGQRLIMQKKTILFEKCLEVVHLKYYNLAILIKNDFNIPFEWAKIFWQYKGLEQLINNKGTYAHATKRQIISVLLSPVIIIVLLREYNKQPAILSFIIVCIWMILNIGFFTYLARKKGLFFSGLALIFTFIDNLIMFLGIICGSTIFMINKLLR